MPLAFLKTAQKQRLSGGYRDPLMQPHHSGYIHGSRVSAHQMIHITPTPLQRKKDVSSVCATFCDWTK